MEYLSVNLKTLQQNFLTRILPVILLIIGIILAISINPVKAETESNSAIVKGDFELRFFPPGPTCAPHTGACLRGTATGDLSGDVFIRVNNSYRVTGSARTVSVSNADITITRPDGEVFGGAAGSLDISTGEFHNVVSWVGGTGPYADADGFMRTDGRDDLSTGIENSSYSGYLRLPKNQSQ